MLYKKIKNYWAYTFILIYIYIYTLQIYNHELVGLDALNFKQNMECLVWVNELNNKRISIIHLKKNPILTLLDFITSCPTILSFSIQPNIYLIFSIIFSKKYNLMGTSSIQQNINMYYSSLSLMWSIVDKWFSTKNKFIKKKSKTILTMKVMNEIFEEVVCASCIIILHNPSSKR